MGLSPDDLPVARDLSNQVLSLSMGPYLDVASVKIVTQTILNEDANA
jgi:dTDP-4-amino-4,6-dideoxygalactose transaminase